MIKVIPNQVVCKNCMAKLEYESSDIIQTVTKYPNIEFIGGGWIINDYVEIVNKYIECPNCKTKIRL